MTAIDNTSAPVAIEAIAEELHDGRVHEVLDSEQQRQRLHVLASFRRRDGGRLLHVNAPVWRAVEAFLHELRPGDQVRLTGVLRQARPTVAGLPTIELLELHGIELLEHATPADATPHIPPEPPEPGTPFADEVGRLEAKQRADSQQPRDEDRP